MERNEFNERIQQDYNVFKATILQLSKEEIFERGFEIDLKSFLTNYLTSDEIPFKQSTINNLSTVEGSILDELYNIYLINDGYYTYDDLCKEILNIFDGGFYEDESGEIE